MKHHNICVLGGTGFVGKHVVTLLARQGHQIRVLTRRRERHRELLVLPTVELRETDVHDPDMLKRQFSGQDTVINLVGILNERRPGDFHRAHVALAEKVVAACYHHGVRRLLHMSALNADARQGPSEYLRTKGEGENRVHEGASEALRVTSFRPSVIFGPEDHFFNMFKQLLRISPGIMPLPCPQARYAPVYVTDVVRAVSTAVDHRGTYSQRYDLCGPNTYTMEELVAFTAQTLGLRRKVWGLSNSLSRLQARFMEWVPGKPFSLDNYHSMQVPSVCPGPFPEIFGIQPTAVEAVVPYYLRQRDQRGHYEHYRRLAGRNA